MVTTSSCPCGSNKKYQDCCHPIHTNQLTALTAEQLMRSRYSAFVVMDEDYLLKSWHPETMPNDIPFEENVKWIGLKILSTKLGLDKDSEGIVKFIARYKIAGKAYRLEEESQFYKIDGRWFYHSAL